MGGCSGILYVKVVQRTSWLQNNAGGRRYIKLRVSFSLGFHCLQHDGGTWCLVDIVKCVWPVDEVTHV